MAVLDTTKVTLPTSVTTAIASKLHDNSAIAALSPADLLTGYTNTAWNYFQGGAQAEVVAEGAQKSAQDTTVKTVTGKLFKVQTTTRVSSELSWSNEDDQLHIIEAIQNDQVGAIAEALDYVVFHAVNPAGGAKLSGYDALTSKATKVIQNADGDTVSDFDALLDALVNADINGIALSRTWASALRKLRSSTGAKLYPEIPATLEVGSLEGIPAVTTRNVSGPLATTATNVLAFAGDFSTIKWRIARPLEVSVIPYGDPDGAGDLQRLNQIAYRTEAVFSYAMLDPTKLAVLKSK